MLLGTAAHHRRVRILGADSPGQTQGKGKSMTLSHARLAVFRDFVSEGMGMPSIEAATVAERLGADLLARAYTLLADSVLAYRRGSDDAHPELGMLADLLAGRFGDDDFDDRCNDGIPWEGPGDIVVRGEGDIDDDDLYVVFLSDGEDDEDEVLEDEE